MEAGPRERKKEREREREILLQQRYQCQLIISNMSTRSPLRRWVMKKHKFKVKGVSFSSRCVCSLVMHDARRERNAAQIKAELKYLFRNN